MNLKELTQFISQMLVLVTEMTRQYFLLKEKH